MTGRQEYDRTKDRQRTLDKYMIDMIDLCVQCICIIIQLKNYNLFVLSLCFRYVLAVLLTIYLSRVLCLSFVLSYSFLSSCHPVILSYLRNAELFFMFKNSNWRSRRDGGFREGGIRDGEIGMDRWKREGVKRLLFFKSPTWEKCRFTVPPAVALLNYISCGILWWIFC